MYAQAYISNLIILFDCNLSSIFKISKVGNSSVPPAVLLCWGVSCQHGKEEESYEKIPREVRSEKGDGGGHPL